MSVCRGVAIGIVLTIIGIGVQKFDVRIEKLRKIERLSQTYNCYKYDSTRPPSPSGHDIMRISGFHLYLQSKPIELHIVELKPSCETVCQIESDRDKNFTIPESPNCIDLNQDYDNCRSNETRCLWTICEHVLGELSECRCAKRWQCNRSCIRHFDLHMYLDLQPHPIERVINDSSDLSKIQIINAEQTWTRSRCRIAFKCVDQIHGEYYASRGNDLIWVRKREGGIIEFAYNEHQGHLFMLFMLQEADTRLRNPMIDFRINMTSSNIEAITPTLELYPADRLF
jgi:hypothetical protein